MSHPDTLESLPGCGLYIHVAYCRKKCVYCDFFSAGSRIADWHRYVDALISELQNRKDELACPLRTVYIGGGTPSLMPADEFRRLTAELEPLLADVEEFTLEVNPDDVTEEMLKVWKRGGVNRLSMGIQSFHDEILATIGRQHDSKTAIEAFDIARKYFDNISIDLMFGLPRQTAEMWREDVATAIRMQPEHMSAYSLMYESGTALTELRDSGRLREIPEEESAEMFLFLIENLRNAGYDHYEISNFAKPGRRSLHNSSYWLQKPYLGIGPSAHSYDGRRIRKANSTNLKGYLRHWAPVDMEFYAGDYFPDVENLSDEELREEYVMTRLRMREGIPIDDFTARFGKEESSRLMVRGKRLIEDGQLELKDGKLSLTESSILLSDPVIVALI